MGEARRKELWLLAWAARMYGQHGLLMNKDGRIRWLDALRRDAIRIQREEAREDRGSLTSVMIELAKVWQANGGPTR